MDVILIYECFECGRQSRALISSVSVRDELALERRLPEGWLINRKGKETYVCDRCQKEKSERLTPPT